MKTSIDFLINNGTIFKVASTAFESAKFYKILLTKLSRICFREFVFEITQPRMANVEANASATKCRLFYLAHVRNSKIVGFPVTNT